MVNVQKSQLNRLLLLLFTLPLWVAYRFERYSTAQHSTIWYVHRRVTTSAAAVIVTDVSVQTTAHPKIIV